MTDISPSYATLVENAPIGVFQVIVDRDSIEEVPRDEQHLYINETLATMLSFDSPEDYHSEVDSVAYADPGDRQELITRLEREGNVEAFETTLLSRDDEPIEVLISGTLAEGTFTGYVTDISERKELERRAAQQAEAILEQSIPIVQIWEGITLATIVGTLDTSRAQRLTEELLAHLTETEAEVALLDITGVPNVDTATAQHLIDTVKAVSLLGSEVIITGINPNIAQTLVHLGITMDDIQTKSSLSEGLEHGLSIIRAETKPTTGAN